PRRREAFAPAAGAAPDRADHPPAGVRRLVGGMAHAALVLFAAFHLAAGPSVAMIHRRDIRPVVELALLRTVHLAPGDGGADHGDRYPVTPEEGAHHPQQAGAQQYRGNRVADHRLGEVLRELADGLVRRAGQLALQLAESAVQLRPGVMDLVLDVF